MNIVPMNNTNIQTMSSREIAELTGKLHHHVIRDIKTMLEDLGEVPTKFGGYYVAPNGKQNPCFNLPKRETLILVSGYSVELRARIIDRWQELEAQVAATPTAPTTLHEALLLAADEAEKRMELGENSGTYISSAFGSEGRECASTSYPCHFSSGL